MWLRDQLPVDLDNARILIYGYNSKLLDGASKQNLLTHLDCFHNDLQTLRDVNSKKNFNRPIILIGHSLGCLLITKVRQFACESFRVRTESSLGLERYQQGS